MNVTYEYPKYSPSLVKEIYYTLRSLSNEYPNFSIWYHQKIPNGWINGTRKIILARNSNKQILGIAILKNSDQKKICTLRVDYRYTRQGIGTELLKRSIELLGTDKPLITVSSNHWTEFEPLFKKFNFEQKRIYLSFYKIDTDEIAYNGYI